MGRFRWGSRNLRYYNINAHSAFHVTVSGYIDMYSIEIHTSHLILDSSGDAGCLGGGSRNLRYCNINADT